jgi:hypothetical protein
MKIGNIGFNEKAWIGKSLEEFTKAFKGKVRSDKIVEAYNLIPKPSKPKKVEKPKEVKG